MGRPPKRTPLSEDDLARLKYQRAVDETGSVLSLPHDPALLASMVHVHVGYLEALNQELTTRLELDAEALHVNPQSLDLPEALRLIIRLLWVLIESADKKRAAKLKAFNNYAAVLERQVQAKQRGRKAKKLAVYFAVTDDDRFSELMIYGVRGSHDIPEMRKQREIVYGYIDDHPLPAHTRSEHTAPSVFQKWVDTHWPELRNRLIVVKCLCDYPPKDSAPPVLPAVQTTVRIPRDKNPDPDADPTEITDGERFKKRFGYAPLDITCALLGHLHRLNPSTVGKLLKNDKKKSST